MFKRTEYHAAHKYSSNHRKQIVTSELCGCFYCIKVYPPSEVMEWVDEDKVGQTALCPYCGIDSVIGSASGVSLDKQFLTEMYKVWFS